MRAYKGFAVDSDGTISCRGHQYVEGETYVHDGPVEMCVAGYHACPMPLDTLRYYQPATSVYHQVEVDDDAQGDGDKIVSRTIRIGARVSVAGMISAHLDLLWQRIEPKRDKAIKKATSGDESIAATSGYASTAATSGDESIAATSGNRSTAATSGYASAAATSGYYSTVATSGNRSTAATSGNHSTAATSGNHSTAATSGYASTAATSGDASTAATSGDYSTAATSGYASAAAVEGNRSIAATSGNRSTAATSGNRSTAATSGDASTAAVEGLHSIAVATGSKGRARGAETCWLVLTERDDATGEILGVQAVPVDGDTIRAGALYVLRGGKVVEVES